MAALTILPTAHFVARARKRAESSSLRPHGVPDVVKVVKCAGQLGGSDRLATAYDCTGCIEHGGHRLEATIRSRTLRTRGTPRLLMTASNRPRPLATRQLIQVEHDSKELVILPTALLIALMELLATFTVRQRRTRETAASKSTRQLARIDSTAAVR